MEKTKLNFRLADLRKAKHITQNEVAEIVGTSYQTISKWETGKAMPDITVLPLLASFFDVSVDELLGLKPLRGEAFQSEDTDSDAFWDEHLEYILRSRNESWNVDYLRFLINDVWKISSPVDILDCGCGYAHLSSLLMPLLPNGSFYTGIDFSSSFTEHARKLLKKENIDGKIINDDFLKAEIRKKYDVVICQSVLRHIGDSRAFIGKMIELTKDGGLIICIDTNREIECCGLYIDGMDYGELCDHSGAIKHWRAELVNKTRDYAAAMRNAHVMRELGVADICIRMNDKVSFISPEQPDYDKRLDDFIDSKSLWYTEPEKAMERLINHGMTKRETENYVCKSEKICRYLSENRGNAALTYFKGKTITFGYKRRKNNG